MMTTTRTTEVQRVLNSITELGSKTWGDRFDISSIAACDDLVINHYRSDFRVKVSGPHGVRTGRISRTTGWRPALILVCRSNSRGSSDILGPDDRIIAVYNGREYVPVVQATEVAEQVRALNLRTGQRLCIDADCPSCGWPERWFDGSVFGCNKCEYTSTERNR